MKKITFLMLGVLLLFGTQAEAQIRILKVNTGNGEITIKNFGGATVDITNYRLCARITYAGGQLTPGIVTNGDLNLSPNEEVTVSWNVILSSTATNSDLGLFLPTGAFSSAAAMVDFTQWGSAGNGRESVAVAKGIWSAGDFISLTTFTSPFVYFGDGSQNGLAFWSDEVTLSVDDEEFVRQTKLFPNPAKELVSIGNGNLKGQVKIMSLSGELVKRTDFVKSINVSDLSAGLYFVEIQVDDRKVIKKLVIQ